METTEDLSGQCYQCNARLQKSMREKEQRRESLPKFERRRWSGGGLAVEDPISSGDIQERSGGGGEEGEDAERRRAEVPACRRATAAERLLYSSVRRWCVRDKGAEEEEGTVGVKRASLPPPPYLYCGTRVMGIVVSAPLPRPFLREVAMWWHVMGRRFV
jgi:hypothetical protein